MASGFGFIYLANIAEPVIILRPIHQADVARIRARREVPAIGNASIEPQAAIGVMRVILGIKRVCMRRFLDRVATLQSA